MIGNAVLALLTATYVFVLALRAAFGESAPFSTWLPFALEVALDLTAAALAARLALDLFAPDHPVGEDAERPWGAPALVCAAFLSTCASTTNFQVLSKVFGVRLSQTMGTWLELEINAPYVACYAFGALALIAFVRRTDPRLRTVEGALLSVAVAGAVLARYAPDVRATGFPLQNQVLHVVCFAVSSWVVGYGLVCQLPGATAGERLIALGFIGLAVSGFLFQLTELHPGKHAFDAAMDLTWTGGQLAAVAGLLVEHGPD